jgi:hypothetical protein
MQFFAHHTVEHTVSMNLPVFIAMAAAFMVIAVIIGWRGQK